MAKAILSFITIITFIPVFIIAQQNDLRITYDANQGVSGLGGASKVYMYSGTVTSSPTGQWEWIVGSPNLDDGIGEMTPLGNDVWTICIDPFNYYSTGIAGPIPNGATLYAIDLFFRNSDGTAFGYDFSNTYMIIDMTTNPPTSNFTGLTIATCAVGGNEIHVADFVMNNFPNPLKTNTTFTFNLSNKTDKLTVTVYDLIGQKVKSFYRQHLNPGLNKINWNGTNDKGEFLKNGIYFYTLEADGITLRSNRMMISR